MRSSLVLIALLCFTTWMSQSDAAHGPMRSCCEHWSKTKVPLNHVKNYTIQPGVNCSIRAIIFQTTKRKLLCSDPNDRWTIRAMRKVDEKSKTLLQESQGEEDGSAVIITPAEAPVSKKKGYVHM
ncbi:C-C motif chemokine 8-like [Halichoeres trimaculatus]|uniref:C-C motif chemokine 8-like n=1 Tax=Halichoeres trimaculatus TaxID=147232 RepID=UPI003D9EA26F